MTGPPGPTNYDTLQEVAFGVIGWTPDTFWNATPREFHNAYAGSVIRLTGKRPEDLKGGEACTRAELEAMMEAYPDG